MNKIVPYISGLVITVLFALSGCDFSTPGVPLWTVEATIPFSERVYKLNELVTDSAEFAEKGWGILVNETDSILKFVYRGDLDTQSIGDRLTYEASDIGRYSNIIGSIHIEEPLPDADTVMIDEANPELIPGYEGPVPPFVMEEAQDTLVFNIFQWVRINQGWMYLTIVNEFPFELENVDISLINLTGSDSIGYVTFEQTIPPGGSARDSIDLTGELIYNELIMQANAESPGSESAVQVTGDERMLIIVGISETDVDSANAEVAEQQFSEPHQLTFDNRNKIIVAGIKSGTASFRLTNTTRFRLFVTMVFNNIKNENGVSLSQMLVMDPLSIGSVSTIDLSGQTLYMTLDDQILSVNNDVNIEDTRVTMFQDSSYQTIAGYQGVDVEYWTNNLILNNLSGVLDSVRVDIPEQSTATDIPEELDNIDFTRDTLFVNINNEVTLPIQLHLEVIGSNSNTGRSAVIPVLSDLQPGPNTLVIPDVDQLTDVLPDTIRVTGWAGLGVYYFPEHADSVGEVASDNHFSGSTRLKSALKFTMGNTRIESDIVELDQELDYPIDNIEVFLRLTNSTPLSGSVKLLMGNDTEAMDTLAHARIPRSPIENHRAMEAIDTTLTIMLGETQLNIMRNLPVFTQQIITFESTMSDTVWVHSQDSLAVQASATIHYVVDIKGGDDE